MATPPSHTNTQPMNGTWDAAASRVPSVFSFISKNMDDKWDVETGLKTLMSWTLGMLFFKIFYFY